MVKIKVVMRLSAKFQESRITSYFSNKALYLYFINNGYHVELLLAIISHSITI